nr:DNA-directed DNA polymerase [Tanacetum cinerariifolium]
MLSGFFQNQTSTSGTLSSNTIPNPKGEMKAITTRSGVAYDGPSIPTPEKVVERETEETTDKEQTNFQGSTALIQPPVIPIPEPDVPKTLPKPNILYPSRHNDQKLREKATNQMEKITFELADRSITHPKGVAEDVFIKVGKFHFPTDFVVVDFKADPHVPLILERSFLRTGRALIDVYGEEITLQVNDESLTLNLNQTTRYSSTYDDMSQGELIKGKSSIEEPPELELKDLPYHLEYAYLEGIDKSPMIIAKDLKVNKKVALLKVLKSHKRDIAWKIIDIKGIDPRFYTHKILMEEDYKSAIQSQRRVNPKIHEVIKKEVIKLLDAGIIYPISHSPWVIPIHCVPKKGGITVVENENNELIPTRLVTGWRVCIDYRKLNGATRKDHFPLPFMDRIPGKDHFHLSLWNICLLKNAFLPLQCSWDISKVEAKALPTNDARVVVKFLKSLFARFETPRAIIRDCGTHFCNDKFAKRILERTVEENRASWSEKLEDALWAFRTAYKMPIGCTPYKLVYGKSCHLPIELEHKAYWDLKHIFSGKLKTHWSGPFTITKVFPYGTVKLSQPEGPNFKVNGHRVKHYFRGDIPQLVVPDLQTFPIEK